MQDDQISRHSTSISYLLPQAPLIMTPVRINGSGPFQFILDTGNVRSAFLLSPRLVAELHIDLADFAASTGYTVGISAELREGRVDSAEVAGIVVCSPEVAIAPAMAELEARLPADESGAKPRIDGNIGYPFLKDYTTTVDFVAMELTLEPGSAASARSSPFELALRRPLIVVDVLVAGRPLRMALDTGAAAMCISTGAAEMLGLDRGEEILINKSEDSRGYLTTLPTVQVGSVHAQDVLAVAAGFLDGLSREIGTHLDGVLGHNFLSLFRLTIDYPGLKLELEEP